MTQRQHDNDDELIERAEELETPSQGGTGGGHPPRDIGKPDEENRFIGGKTGVTRVRKSDEQDDPDAGNPDVD